MRRACRGSVYISDSRLSEPRGGGGPSGTSRAATGPLCLFARAEAPPAPERSAKSTTSAGRGSETPTLPEFSSARTDISGALRNGRATRGHMTTRERHRGMDNMDKVTGGGKQVNVQAVVANAAFICFLIFHLNA